GSGSCPTCMAFVAKPMVFSLTEAGTSRQATRSTHAMKRNERHATWVRTRSFHEWEAAQFKQLTGGVERRQLPARFLASRAASRPATAPVGRGTFSLGIRLSAGSTPLLNLSDNVPFCPR